MILVIRRLVSYFFILFLLLPIVIVPRLAYAAPLVNDAVLSIGSGASPDATGMCSVGSCFGMEIITGLWVWTMLEPGTDGGIVVGANQLSGGQEAGPSATITTPGDMTAAWTFFSSYGTFFADNSLNVFSDTSNSGETALNNFNVAWEGAVVPMGNGVVNVYTISSLDSSYLLDYTAVVPEGDPSGFGGMNFRLVARGLITTPPTTEPNNVPVVNNVAISGDSGAVINWTPDFTDDIGDAHTCLIELNANSGNATVNSDCSGGTYTSGEAFEGADSFTYQVTDQDGASATGTVDATVILPPVSTACVTTYPVRNIISTGSGQRASINDTLWVSFTGHIITNNKSGVSICPETTIAYDVMSSVGVSKCTINGVATAATGEMTIGDKLICNNKPDGSDTDRFSVKSGI